MILSENREDELRKFATKIRLNTLRTLNHLGFGHYGGSLSIVEVLAVLYGEIISPPMNFSGLYFMGNMP